MACSSFIPLGEKRLVKNIKRYLQIYAALWRNSVVREMGFKSNFILWIFVELLWFGLQLSVDSNQRAISTSSKYSPARRPVRRFT